MAIGGPFLSSYLQQYLQSRQLGQQQPVDGIPEFPELGVRYVGDG